ncbi:DNA-binding transcriptional regulator, AcrR family [Friedmanniella luteola]|uniref:DNA-binding transcriptional regulator, AcrR family n=1 Tax=Friedmanniella luteola TaxID=546871 RepID=A0A1H1Y5U4_9ACTN|nr:TetR family transcriptional regulator [Friedmanniella luteola]SDT16878.1 DNA-binding transcriptional regulator, AcrR family [Friedmanniella luteola]
MTATTADVRSRVLLAARAEFAERGLAGARVDRIAAEARASKERLYAYFGDKVTLFQAVLDADAAEFHAAVTLDPADVAGFVGAVFDESARHPEHLRMLTWARLEGIPYRLPDEAVPRRKLEALEQAQREGRVDPGWRPEDLLELLFSVAHAWVQTPVRPEDQVSSPAEQRAAAVEAARRILAAPVP